MTAQPLIADMPRDISMTGGYIIRVTALDAATGATIAGVNVSGVVITALNVGTGQIESFPGNDLTVLPLFELPAANSE